MGYRMYLVMCTDGLNRSEAQPLYVEANTKRLAGKRAKVWCELNHGGCWSITYNSSVKTLRRNAHK